MPCAYRHKEQSLTIVSALQQDGGRIRMVSRLNWSSASVIIIRFLCVIKIHHIYSCGAIVTTCSLILVDIFYCNYFINRKFKSKVVPTHTMKAYMAGRYIAPPILDPSTGWRWILSLMSLPPYPWGRVPQYPFSSRQRWSGYFEK
jgi:hypothetical protein